MIAEYNLGDDKILRCSNHDIRNLQKFSIDPERKDNLLLSPDLAKKLDVQDKVDPTEIAWLTIDSGYLALLLTGSVEGGEQVVIPKGSHATLDLVRLHIGLHAYSEDMFQLFKEEVESKFGLMKKEYGCHWFSFTPDQAEAALELLNFHMSLGIDVYKVDYKALTVEYNDED